MPVLSKRTAVRGNTCDKQRCFVGLALRRVILSQDQLVVVRVEKVKDFEAFVSLLEYQDIEGMILLSEV